MKYSLIVKTLLFSSIRSHMRITLLPDDATEEKLRGVSKDTRSSDSSRKAFVRKVREIGVAVKLVNLHIGG